jgi:hypothetical protein
VCVAPLAAEGCPGRPAQPSYCAPEGGGDPVLLIASLSRISRHLGKLMRVMEYLLAHDVPILTANYLLRPREVWVAPRRAGSRRSSGSARGAAGPAGPVRRAPRHSGEGREADGGRCTGRRGPTPHMTGSSEAGSVQGRTADLPLSEGLSWPESGRSVKLSSPLHLHQCLSGACRSILAAAPTCAGECRFVRVVPVLIFSSGTSCVVLCWRKALVDRVFWAPRATSRPVWSPQSARRPQLRRERRCWPAA